MTKTPDELKPIHCKSCNKEMSKDDIELGHPYGFCYECYLYEEQQNEEAEMERYVTKEMAMDACDPSLEGQRY